MSDRGRLAGKLMNWVGGDSAMDVADGLIAEGYGVVWVSKATALEEAAEALADAAQEHWRISDVLDFLYDRAEKIGNEALNSKETKA